MRRATRPPEEARMLRELSAFVETLQASPQVVPHPERAWATVREMHALLRGAG